MSLDIQWVIVAVFAAAFLGQIIVFYRRIGPILRRMGHNLVAPGMIHQKSWRIAFWEYRHFCVSNGRSLVWWWVFWICEWTVLLCFVTLVWLRITS